MKRFKENKKTERTMEIMKRRKGRQKNEEERHGPALLDPVNCVILIVNISQLDYCCMSIDALLTPSIE
jgi:hypothetical protein